MLKEECKVGAKVIVVSDNCFPCTLSKKTGTIVKIETCSFNDLNYEIEFDDHIISNATFGLLDSCELLSKSKYFWNANPLLATTNIILLPRKISCYKCGKMNDDEVSVCWNCAALDPTIVDP